MIIWILSAILSVIAVVFIIMWTTILVARVAILVEDIRSWWVKS